MGQQDETESDEEEDSGTEDTARWLRPCQTPYVREAMATTQWLMATMSPATSRQTLCTARIRISFPDQLAQTRSWSSRRISSSSTPAPLHSYQPLHLLAKGCASSQVGSSPRPQLSS